MPEEKTLYHAGNKRMESYKPNTKVLKWYKPKEDEEKDKKDKTMELTDADKVKAQVEAVGGKKVMSLADIAKKTAEERAKRKKQ